MNVYLYLFSKKKKISVEWYVIVLLFSTDCSLRIVLFLSIMKNEKRSVVSISLCVPLSIIFVNVYLYLYLFSKKKKISILIESPTDVGGGIVYDTGSCTIRVD